MKKGIEFYKANGKDKALAAFNDPKGQFVKDDLYIYVLDLNGKMLAHTKADLVGKDFMVVKDADGKTFAVDIVKTAKALSLRLFGFFGQPGYLSEIMPHKTGAGQSMLCRLEI